MRARVCTIRLLLPSSKYSVDSGGCDSGQNSPHLDLMDAISSDLIVSTSNLHVLVSHGHKYYAKEGKAVSSVNSFWG